MTESQLQSKICDYLQKAGYCFSRINNTPVFDPKRKIFRSMGKYVMRGFPDIVVIVCGRFVGLEIKSERGRQSDAQKLAQERIEKAGGYYCLINNWQEFSDRFIPKCIYAPQKPLPNKS